MEKKTDLKARLQTILATFIQKRKFEQAIEDLLAMLEDYGNQDLIAYYLGVCYSNSGKYDEAIDCLEYIVDSPDLSLMQLIQTNMILGFLYTETGDYRNAEISLKEVLTLNPQSSMAYSALGYVYYLNKNFDQAVQNFRRALQYDPNNASAHNNLGFTYLEMGVNYNEAIQECQKAVALHPKSAAYRDSLGWAYYQTGNFKQAVKELDSALQHPCTKKDIIIEHFNQAVRKRDQVK